MAKLLRRENISPTAKGLSQKVGWNKMDAPDAKSYFSGQLAMQDLEWRERPSQHHRDLARALGPKQEHRRGAAQHHRREKSCNGSAARDAQS